MAGRLTGRSFLKLLDFTPDEIKDLVERAATLKAMKRAGVRSASIRTRDSAGWMRSLIAPKEIPPSTGTTSSPSTTQRSGSVARNGASSSGK